ncbi:sodium:proton antiporter [Brachyspira hampsonii]|uniref:Sodium:proton antiporter n=1 Tax=Brachyspira hampsonii TaxID=1287055 RepID=A0A1E5NBX4_9SPIR|nr:Na+/H+ antiporter NhaC family protein [Brachyspira hampsonii]OEJ13655.1 sodium:proton antiporter [Brachyspira hampsonii]
MEEENKGSFLGLIPLIIFLAIYMFSGLYTGSFENMPLMVGILISSGAALLLNKKSDKKKFETKVDMYCEGGGEKTLILMVLIFILAGAFSGAASKMGAVSSIVNMGLSIIPANLILPGIFVIGCILSFSMGTSMGTVSALMPIAIDLANKTNINMPLIAGVVVGSAMFGDNLSFISDTTIAATRTQEVSMKSKFQENIFMVLPAIIVNIILLMFQPVGTIDIGNHSNFSIINIIPYIAVIGLSLSGINVVITMSISIIIAIIIGIFNGSFTLVESFKIVHNGMMGMEDMAIIAVFVGGLVALMKHLGGIDWILYTLSKNTKTSKGGELSIAALVSLIDISTTNNTVSIIAAGPIAANIADKFGISRKRTASILDLFSSAFNGISPFAGQLLVAGGLAKISPISIVPYVWYCILMIIFGIIEIIIGYPHFIKKDK